MILEKGDLQFGDKERESQSSSIFNDIVNFIAEKCVHPQSKRLFSVASITQAIQDIHFTVKLDKPAKPQALECIKELQKKYNIVRAEMKVKITIPLKKQEILESILEKNNLDLKNGETVIKEEILEHKRCIEPYLFRVLNEDI